MGGHGRVPVWRKRGNRREAREAGWRLLGDGGRALAVLVAQIF